MKKRAKRFWYVTAICGGTALLFLTFAWTSQLDPKFEWPQRLEFWSQDHRAGKGLKTPVDPRLVLIGVDQPVYPDFFRDADLLENPALRLLQRNYPWSRAVWADLITRLGDAGAKAIVLDFVFGGQGDGDDALRGALDKYKNQVVIGCNIHDIKSDRGAKMTLDPPNAAVLNSSSPTSPALDERVGYVNIWPERDDVLRFSRYRMDGSEAGDLENRGTVLESLDARALRKFGHPELIPAGTDPIRFRYTDWAGLGYPAISLADVLLPRTWRANFQNGEFFRDKIVLIGPTADIFQDYHKTALPENDIKVKGIPIHRDSVMSGPEVHLNLIGAALNGRFLRDTPWAATVVIILLAGVVASVLSFLIHSPVIRSAAMLVIGFCYWHFGQWTFDHRNLVIPEAMPLLVLGMSGVFVLGYDYFAEFLERTRVRKTLERYVSKNIVKELLDNPATYFHTLEGVRKPVTVLFSDLRSFTTLTEHSDSTKLVQQLNEYFAEMVQTVFKYEGTLDKFIGDAVMAVWGNIVTKGPEQDAQHAVSTALAMKRSLVKLNAGWKKRQMKELAFGIGINHGEAIVGNLGSNEKMELTVIGDAVNTASRLEGLTKQFYQELLIGEAVAPLVRDKFILRSVGLILPKGKTIPAEVYTVLGERTMEVNAKQAAWLAEYEAAVKLYRARDFKGALDKFERCLHDQREDFLCGMYIKECEALIKDPPYDSWNGVFVIMEK